MPTESLLVKYSPNRTYRIVDRDPNSFIHGLHDALVKVGWTVGGLYASVDFIFPLTIPTQDGTTISPKRVVGCGNSFVTVEGRGYVLYNPNRELPISNPVCVFVGMGLTASDTVSNLCVAITFSSNFNATFVSRSPAPGFIVSLVAKIAGPDLNFVDNNVNGGWGTTSGNTQGGGYEFFTSGVDSAYSVKVRPYSSFFDYKVFFDFSANGGTAQLYLSTGVPLQPVPDFPLKQYVIIANKYQFLIHNQETHEFAFSSIFACAPYIMADVSYAMFVIGPGMLNFYTFYNLQVSAVALDTPLLTIGNQGGWPRLICFRSPSVIPLTTPNGKSLYTSAYITYGKDNIESGAIVGIIWDCVISSDVISTPDPADLAGVSIAKVKFLTIGFQTGLGGGTRSSLLMAIPTDPDTAPKAGTCNLFGAGVTRLTGSTFTASDVGRVITINGQSGTIKSVEDGDHLTLEAPVAIIANGTFNIPY